MNLRLGKQLIVIGLVLFVFTGLGLSRSVAASAELPGFFSITEYRALTNYRDWLRGEQNVKKTPAQRTKYRETIKGHYDTLIVKVGARYNERLKISRTRLDANRAVQVAEARVRLGTDGASAERSYRAGLETIVIEENQALFDLSSELFEERTGYEEERADYQDGYDAVAERLRNVRAAQKSGTKRAKKLRPKAQRSWAKRLRKIDAQLSATERQLRRVGLTLATAQARIDRLEAGHLVRVEAIKSEMNASRAEEEATYRSELAALSESLAVDLREIEEDYRLDLEADTADAAIYRQEEIAEAGRIAKQAQMYVSAMPSA